MDKAPMDDVFHLLRRRLVKALAIAREDYMRAAAEEKTEGCGRVASHVRAYYEGQYSGLRTALYYLDGTWRERLPLPWEVERAEIDRARRTQT